MASTRDLRRRIKSIKNTRKVTNAMEVVSAVKMKKAIAAVLAVRAYAHAAWSVLTDIAQGFLPNQHELLSVRDVKRVLLIVITSNKGLCGSFNAQIFKKVREELLAPDKLLTNRVGARRVASSMPKEKLVVDFVTVGKKGERFVRLLGKDIIASFPQLNYDPTVDAVRPLSHLVIDAYTERRYDKVAMVYTDFVNPVVQQLKIRQLLPVSRIDLEKQLAEMDVLAREYGLSEQQIAYAAEPNEEEALSEIFPRLIEVQLYHAILESNASKESARMVAMKNATEAAGDIIDDLTLAYNQLRQSKITQEILEISAGRAALEG